MTEKVSEKIKKQLEQDGVRHWACDNISKYLSEEDKFKLIDELTANFEGVLDSLLIDRKTDPNSMDTPRRLAKMYINELMEGRFSPPPEVTAFPNDDQENRYSGLLNVKCEIISMCSHHHQPVKGVCYIGVIPSIKVIGLSKYIRIAQHCARRGTLQEELAKQIMDAIIEETGSKDVGVYIQATHGCVEHRGVCAHSSLTQTTVLNGQFYNPSVKSEWLTNIQIQEQQGRAR